MPKANIVQFRRLPTYKHRENETGKWEQEPVTDLHDIIDKDTTSYTTSTLLVTLEAGTRYIRVCPDGNLHLGVGAAATANDLRIATDQAEYFKVQGGEALYGYDGSS